MFANADAYERFMGRWSRPMAARLLDFAGVPDRSRVLDLGVGTGSLSIELAARLPACHIVGIDSSEGYLAYAQARVPNPRVQLRQGHAEELPFPDAAFDASLSLLVFNFLLDPRKALAELRRVTRPGGTICAATWDYGEGMQMLRVFWDAATALNRAAERLDEKHMPLCRADELSALWQAGGLTHVKEQPLEIAMSFRSFADFWEPFLAGQGPAGAYVAQLSPDHRIALRDRLQSVLTKRQQRNGFELLARAWGVRGTVLHEGVT